MPLPKTILVPTDFGDPSEAAIDYAVELARAIGAEIVLMHAYELPVVGFPDGALVATAQLGTQLLEGAQVGLERQIKVYSASGVSMRGLIRQGDPYALVNDVVEEIGADMIVMGTHGRTGIPRALLGSVAEKIVRTAKVPVLTVHAAEMAAVAAPEVVDSSETPARILPTNHVPASVR